MDQSIAIRDRTIDPYCERCLSILHIKSKKNERAIGSIIGAGKSGKGKPKADKLNKELDFQNQKLTSYALNFVKTNEVLSEIKENLAHLMKSGSGEITKSINRVNRIVDQNINKESDWDDFKMHFEDVHKDFFLKLKHTYPDLTSNDMKICALTLLNLNLKESSVILGISPESVKIARYRLKKRMGLEKDESLINHLIKYANLWTNEPV